MVLLYAVDSLVLPSSNRCIIKDGLVKYLSVAYISDRTV